MNPKAPPAGFAEIRTGNVRVWVREGFAFLFNASGRLKVERPSCPVPSSTPYQGRAEMTRVSLGSSGPPCGLVRHYRRGGLFQHLLRDGYLGEKRFQREVMVTERARAGGLSTVEVLALRTERVFPGVYQADLMTREIENALDLDAFLKKILKQDRPAFVKEKTCTIPLVAGVVRKMHDAGLFHADLNLKNLLMRGDITARECFIIDLDKARFFPEPVDRRRRLNNLLRLYRSLEKLGFSREAVTLRDIVRFVRSYCRGDRKLMAACRQRIRKVPLSLRIHRFFWNLSRIIKKESE
jgi:tRNA A-37 threonylcarbamoyl transferase component Bud32